MADIIFGSIFLIGILIIFYTLYKFISDTQKSILKHHDL
jgi:hypothetical protein